MVMAPGISEKKKKKLLIAWLPTKHIGVRVRAFQIELEFESVGFRGEGKSPEYPQKNLSEQRREPTTNSTHIWRRRQAESNWEARALTTAPSLALQ